MAAAARATDVLSRPIGGAPEEESSRSVSTLMTSSSRGVDPYRFVHDSIRDILVSDPPPPLEDGTRPILVDPTTLRVRWEELMDRGQAGSGGSNNGADGNGTPEGGSSMLPMSTLVALASQFERAIFVDRVDGGDGNDAVENGGTVRKSSSTMALSGAASSILSTPMLGALRLAVDADDAAERDAKTLASTLLVMNLLESSVCRLAGKRRGRAPLLKNMIEDVARVAEAAATPKEKGVIMAVPREVAPVLRTLLLPVGLHEELGLNLRNILWHGYLGSIPRKWLALTVGLTAELERFAEACHHPGGADNATDLDYQRRALKSVSSDLSSSVSGLDPCDEWLDSVRSLPSHGSLAPLLEHGHSILSSSAQMEQLYVVAVSSPLVPPSHRSLLRLALDRFASGATSGGDDTNRGFDVSFAAVICVLLEHGLRLLWCDSNARPNDDMARPGSYFVTLDGHGRRGVHHIVLAPFLSVADGDGGGGIAVDKDRSSDGVDIGGDGMERNGLVERLGGPLLSFLADVFCSPSGPNIRSAVTHGLCDRYLLKELEQFADVACRLDETAPASIAGEPATKRSCISGETTPAALSDVSALLIAALHLAAVQSAAASFPQNGDDGGRPATAGRLTFPKESLRRYRPVFSYTACMMRDVDSVLRGLGDLEALQEQRFVSSSITGMDSKQGKISASLSRLGVPLRDLAEAKRRIFALYDLDASSPWTVEDVFTESLSDSKLVDCGAARILLSDVSSAAAQYIQSVGEALVEIHDDDGGGLNKRRRRRHARLCSLAALALDLYSFFVRVALLHIESKVSSERGREGNGEEHSPPAASGEMLSDAVMLRAVERSRMCGSTFARFTYSNLDRALKSAEEYQRGKAVKAVASFLGR